jgi:SAM-dependent methyltransferase
MIKKIHFFLSNLLFDPLLILNKWKAIPHFIRNYVTYNRLLKGTKFKIATSKLFFTTYEKFQSAGVVKGHYFFQDIWAAEKIFKAKVEQHVDVGSRIDGFIAHVLPFAKVYYVDLRKIDSKVNNLQFIQGSILSLPFSENSISSLSCLHVIEHIGLGRYGDEVDPEGYLKAAKELTRVLKPGGKLYLGTPVGVETLYFDAHRVFNVETVVKAFEGLDLLEFSLIDDIGEEIFENAIIEKANGCKYGCGLFIFTKK